MAAGSIEKARALALNLTQLERARGHVGRLKFSKVNGRVVVEATPKWSLKQFLVNTLFRRQTCHTLYKQAHEFLKSADYDTPLRERVVKLVEDGVFPYLMPWEKAAIHKLVPEPVPLGVESGELDGAVEMAETAFNDPRNDSGILFDSLWNAMPEPSPDNELQYSRLAIFEKALRHLEDAQAVLTNPSLSAKDKQATLSQDYGLFFHLTREQAPTTPEAANAALDNVAFMLRELTRSDNEAVRQEALMALLSSDMPCHEAQITQAMIAFQRIVQGIEIPEDGDDFKDTALDKNATIEQNFLKLLYEFGTQFPDDDQTVEKFIHWATERDGVVNFVAADGQITEKVIEEQAEYARDTLVMLS